MGTRIDDHDALRKIVASLQAEGKTVVFTNGSFDVLHVGHVRALVDARSRGDCLVLGLNSDASVRAYKDPDLPIVPEDERAELLCALACVDYVTLFSDPSADAILLALRPDIHCKGTDYTEESVPERETVLSFGGRIAIVGDPKDHSSTDLRARIAAFSRKKR